MSFSKKSLQLLLICTIGIGLLVYLCGCWGFGSVKEGFANGWQGTSPRPPAPVIGEEDVAPLRKQLEGLFVTAGEALCPSFTMVRDEIAKGKKGASAEEKNKAAVAQMQKEAGGKIYDCRSYPDHLQVPADIGSIIQSTAVYLDKKLGGLLERVEAALSCKPLPPEEGEDTSAANDYDPVVVPPELREAFKNGATVEHYGNVVEYYADVCTPEQMTVRKKDAEEKAALANASSCAAPDEISFAQQKVLLETRIKNIEGVLKDAEWAPRIKRVQDTLRRFQEIKAKVDAGTLVPNCGAGF
jgi:cytochrome c5